MNEFPKHTVIRDNENPLFQEWRQKQIGFSPLVMCEFFQGFEVLQMQGVTSGEYLFGLYFSGRLVGHAYFGNVYTDLQAAAICKELMPPTWEDIPTFVREKGDKAWYYKFHQSQYAWITEPVLTKI